MCIYIYSVAGDIIYTFCTISPDPHTTMTLSFAMNDSFIVGMEELCEQSERNGETRVHQSDEVRLCRDG